MELSFSLKTNKSVVIPAPKWTSLAALGNAKAVQLTALIPVIGYMIIFNRALLEYMELGLQYLNADETVKQGSGVPLDRFTAVNLYFLYFGLCALGVGSLLFRLSCPEIFKKYNDAASFVLTEQAITTQRTMDLYQHDFSSYGATIDRNKYSTINGDMRTDVMRTYYQTLDQHSVPILRLVVAVLFAIGFALLTWPSLRVLYAVAQSLLSLLAS
jgi:hypothetical protein